ncbi:endonuclease domain-containing protein [Gleimia sp. 6138-11-ORH1]|uniref:endonuclease domain-containing protein n=1 Tax=Gleimia sp. 6138-11-ORH1 TaxID=2973937 RepID=UPI0021684267|nr:endonuclease domain-containing protein [Gleimia sp. 6138-11-ORH1]MCS4485027.1 endonuclease domain-containing protein [Gleimia sp. 6138-11-ORH1]
MKTHALNRSTSATQNPAPSCAENPRLSHQPSLVHAPSKILQHTKEVMHRTRSTVALTLYPASLLYELPSWNLPQEINVLYFKQRTFSKTKVGRDKFGNGITVRRYFRNFPPEAVTVIDKQPILRLEWLLLDFLLLKNPYNALVTANAILRKLVGASRENSQAQQLLTQRYLTYFEALTRKYISSYYQQRVLRRIRLLNPLSESPLESVIEVAIRQLKYRTYKTQAPIPLPHTTFYTDGLLPRLKVVVEADGEIKRRADPELVRQRSRERLIKSLGYRIIRFSADECWDRHLLENICRKLAKRPPVHLHKI